MKEKNCFGKTERKANCFWLYFFFFHPLPALWKVTFSCFRVPFPQRPCAFTCKGQNLRLFLADCSREQDVSGSLCVISRDGPGQWLMADRHGRRKAPALFQVGPLWGVINPPEFSAGSGPGYPPWEKTCLSFSALSCSSLPYQFFFWEHFLNKLFPMNLCLSVYSQGTQPKAVSDLEYFRNRLGRP